MKTDRAIPLVALLLLTSAAILIAYGLRNDHARTRELRRFSDIALRREIRDRLCAAARRGDPAEMRRWLSSASPGDIDAALLAAGEAGTTVSIRMLLEHVNRHHYQTRPDVGSLLVSAARFGYADIAALALQHAAAPGGRVGSRPPLTWAAARGHADVTRLLLDHGAAIDATIPATYRDPEIGFTALMLAARYGHAPVVRLLLARRANVHVRTPSGQSALQVALAGPPPAPVIYGQSDPLSPRADSIASAVARLRDRTAVVAQLRRARVDNR